MYQKIIKLVHKQEYYLIVIICIMYKSFFLIVTARFWATFLRSQQILKKKKV